ncbi:unnamed protein product [Didymodactylos carnosus]|uniref:Uncharacterized protein n=1 Tax=Didymodactylos carnosus TaxID=1234261 RepID=A0A814IEL9_9BILA|nr:unnamed protein product [Didymodactylos carnosus]CAF3794793.1 unnamed protein product [Didymodactylos carnosus]
MATASNFLNTLSSSTAVVNVYNNNNNSNHHHHQHTSNGGNTSSDTNNINPQQQKLSQRNSSPSLPSNDFHPPRVTTTPSLSVYTNNNDTTSYQNFNVHQYDGNSPPLYNTGSTTTNIAATSSTAAVAAQAAINFYRNVPSSSQDPYYSSFNQNSAIFDYASHPHQTLLHHPIGGSSHFTTNSHPHHITENINQFSNNSTIHNPFATTMHNLYNQKQDAFQHHPQHNIFPWMRRNLHIGCGKFKF